MESRKESIEIFNKNLKDYEHSLPPEIPIEKIRNSKWYIFTKESIEKYNDKILLENKNFSIRFFKNSRNFYNKICWKCKDNQAKGCDIKGLESCKIKHVIERIRV